MTRRWEKARHDTKGFAAWKREAVLGIAAGATAIVLLIAFGHDDAAYQEALIVIGTIVGTIVLVPLIELAWNFLKAPQRLLREDLSDLQAEVQDLASLVRPEAAKMRTVLRALHEEASDSLRLMELANSRKIFWKPTETSPATKIWKKHRAFLASQRDLEDLYESGRLAAQEVERVLGQRAVRTFIRWRRDIQEEDRVPDAVAALQDFEARLAIEIKRLDGGKTGQ